MGNQRSSPAPSSLAYALPRLHQLCTPAPNENAAKVVVKFCYDFFLLPFAIRHSPFDVRRVLEHISNVLSVAGREQGREAEHQEDSHADEHDWLGGRVVFKLLPAGI